MKKIVKIIIYILLLGLIFQYKEQIIDKITYVFDSNHKVIIDTPNKYYKNKEYSFVKQSTNFVPYSKQDLINIYYSVLDRGYETFTFYCPKEYTSCINDIEDISSNNNDILSVLNYFVSPFNAEKKITTTYSTNGEITLNIEKLYTEEEINIVNNKIDEILNNIITNDMSLEDKILTIHDYIINTTQYDTAALENNTTYHSHISYGTLIEGYSTCNGYADTMALFLDRLDVLNYRVVSSTHVWNAIYINNQWLHLDLTWDDPITKDSNNITHKFYLIDTPTLESYNITDHNFDKTIFLEVC